MRCPGANQLLVGKASIVTSYVVPGSMSSGCSHESLYRQRMIPSVMFIANPSG